MKEQTTKQAELLPLSVSDADKLLACADGASALLFLHMLRTGSLSVSKAARDLRCPGDEIERAADNLRRLGMLAPEEKPPEAGAIPQYSAEEIARRAKTDTAFEGLVYEAQQAFGRPLSNNDLRILFGIYDHLGLPPEVIYLLLNHCVERYREVHGEGRTPTLRSVEKEAWRWVNRELTTYEAVEEYLIKEKRREDALEQIKARLQIRGRELSPTEKKYSQEWLEQEFSPEVIAVAYDRTVLRTGKVNWGYMDSILKDWKKRGLLTPEDIARGDPVHKGKSSASGKAAPSQAQALEDNSRDIENMRKLYESMKGGQ